MTLMPLLLSAVLTFPDEPFDMAPLEMHEFPSREFRITDFGARAGDGSKSTEAIASAVEACVAAGGGRVVVPEGRFFTGNVRLRSGVELHLEDGAVLEFSDDPADYLPSVPVSWEGVECRGYAPLVYAYGCTNVAITGNGTLTARMDRWMEWATLYRDNSLALLQTMLKWGRDGVPVEKRDLTAYPTGGKRPHGIGFNRCRNIRLEGFKVREMPFWTIHVFHSDDVLCRRLDLSNHIGNSDGIDIDSTRHVLIEDCQLDQADDGFVMKSGRDHDGRRLGRATEDVVVRNCRIRFAHVLLGCGSELSGGIRNISLHDCTLTDCYKGFYVKTNPGRGGFVENVWFRNVHVRSCAQLVAVKTSVSIGLPDAELCLTRIRGIHAENVSCRTADVGILLMGDARLPVRDVSLKNVHVEAVSSAFKQIENVDDLREEDVSFGNGRADISDNPESRRIVFWGDAVPEALPAQEREKVDRGVYVFDFSRGRGTWQQAAEALRPRDCLFVKTKCAADAEELVRAARSRASWVLDDIREVPQDFYRSEVRDPHLNRVPLRLFASRPRTETLLDGADWNVPVPHTWNVEDGSDGQDVPPDALCNQSAMRSSYRRGPFTYVRALPPMPLWPRRYFLAFEGASAKTIVRVNGREVGRHDGAFTSFCFEITEALRPDTNRLEVVVDNTYDPEGLPVNADYTMQGGLYRSVRLLDCPVACIDPRVPVRIETDCDSGTATAHYVFTTPAGDFKRTQSARYPRFERWNPDVPALYRFELKDGADRLSLPFGFRTAEFRGGYFHMNGKRIFLKGVNRHQDRAGKGWALSAEDEEEDVRLMKEMGCNAVRTSHYPQSRAFLDACDRLGLVVWSEMPLVDLVTPTEAFRTNLLTVTTEAVEQQYNHPSVCLWSAYNELYNFLTPPMPDGTAEPYVVAKRVCLVLYCSPLDKAVIFGVERLPRIGV